MGSEDMTSGDDVTIYLVKKLVVEEASRERKRRKQEDGVNYGTSLGEIHVNSCKLRQCSKYFDTCMSERWTSDAATESSSRSVFYVEVQTEVSYYEDCFSRMKFSFPKPIPSVTHCIELLKVASQIQYEDLVHVGMKYLATVPWIGDREKQIREFCNSGYFAAESASDLKARLDLSLPKDEKQKKHLELLKKTLSQHFALALYPKSTEELLTSGFRIADLLDSRELFATGFHSAMSDSESDMCHKLQEYLVTLVKEESEKILVSLSNDPYDEETVHVDADVTRIFWLYETTRRGNGSQVIVERILKNEKIKRTLDTAEFEVQIKWANVLHYMFEDLLNGHLFLSALERRTLFSTWNWMFNDEYMPHIGESDLVDFVTRIVMTFPLLEQEEIFHAWVVLPENESILSQYYTTWLSELLTEVTKRELKSEGEDNSADKMEEVQHPPGKP